jgi:hypothetical protein
MPNFERMLDALAKHGGTGTVNLPKPEALIGVAGRLHRAGLESIRAGRADPVRTIRSQLSWLAKRDAMSSDESATIANICKLMMLRDREADAIAEAKMIGPDASHLAQFIAAIVIDSLNHPMTSTSLKGRPPIRPAIGDVQGALLGARLGFPAGPKVMLACALVGAILGSV